MPRPDWDITRLELSKTFYADNPTLIETVKIRHTMIHRPTRINKIFEMNYTTPTDNDLTRQENIWIQRLELSAQVPLVPMGPIDTKDPVPTPEQHAAAQVALALQLTTAAEQARTSLTTQAAVLKTAFPTDAAAIDAALADSLASASARLAQALDALKAIP
jgi:hypothetical protein